MYGDTEKTAAANGWKCCGRWGIAANKHGISFGGNEKFLEFDNDDLQLCKYAKNH